MSLNLSGLETHVIAFDAAFKLFGFSQEQFDRKRSSFDRAGVDQSRLFLAWKFIAARDGALSIYNFAKIMEAIRSSMNEVPTIRAIVDHAAIRLAVKKFESKLPDFEGVRHSVAHSAEFVNSQEAIQRNAFSGTLTAGPVQGIFKSLTIHNSLVNSKFTTSLEGRLISYDVSQATLDVLNSAKRDFYAVFAPVETATMAMPPSKA